MGRASFMRLIKMTSGGEATSEHTLRVTVIYSADIVGRLFESG